MNQTIQLWGYLDGVVMFCMDSLIDFYPFFSILFTGDGKLASGVKVSSGFEKLECLESKPKWLKEIERTTSPSSSAVDSSTVGGLFTVFHNQFQALMILFCWKHKIIKILASYSGLIWRFPEIGVSPSHPFERVFPL